MRHARLSPPAFALALLVLASTPPLLAAPKENAAQPDKPHLVIITGEDEYDAAQTLPAFAREYLQNDFQVTFVAADPQTPHSFPGMEVLDQADVALIYVRRRAPSEEQLAHLRKFIADGKAVVGLRTANHAFSINRGQPPAGHVQWPEFDAEVLGGNYQGHHNNHGPGAPPTAVTPVAEAQQHPILTGIPNQAFDSRGSLYKVRPLKPGTQVLMMGHIPGDHPPEPVAWTKTTSSGGRVFYTSLGHPEDFKLPAFKRLLLNSLYWAAERDVPKTLASDWTKLPVPGAWEEVANKPFQSHDGFAWYRCQIKIPAAWKGETLRLVTEQVDNCHEIYFNDRRIGGAGSFPPNYEDGSEARESHWIAARLVRAGETNLLAIRVYNHGGLGGFRGAAPKLLSSTGAISLKGDWQFRLGDDAAWAKLTSSEDAQAIPLFDQVAEDEAVSDTLLSRRGGLSPADAMQHFQVADDVQLDQVLTEPEVRQPVFINFDERGRMWVVQYLQYPHPAGLKIVSRDNFWRAVYDKVPAAPPNHVRGRDKITIHEDTNGDGIFDTQKTFLDGLNICTAVERGRGGVWVLNPPYLLFYPDRDQDDVPDGDPEVHLAGFGLEDTHSVVNSLRWGPDGWLYGAQGSTVTGNVVRPGLDQEPRFTQGQLIWRYHPETRRYEIFAEGGGNAFGCEIDAKGRIFSGHNGGNTRGFYYMQGAYLLKGFTKHGPLSNPYAFGFFDAMKHHEVPRFTHNFVIYEGGALPSRYTGQLIGIEPLQSQIVLSEFSPDGSTFRTSDVTRPVTSTDNWFRPVDIKTGPDGGVYIVDWYDGQLAHTRNHEGYLDPTNGRIYRMRAPNFQPAAPFDLSKRSSAELIETLRHPNKWFRQTALRVLADRRDATIIPQLRTLLAENDGQFALECLWALHLSGGLDDSSAHQALQHDDPYVRLWTVRLLCDDNQVSPALAEALQALARQESHVEVRAQLAASARRLPATECLAIVQGLVQHGEDAGDPQVPLLVWWAIESKCGSSPAEVLALFEPSDTWQQKLVSEHLLSRLMRRFALSGTRTDLLRCAQLFELSLLHGHTQQLMQGFEQAMQGRSLAGMPPELVDVIARAGGGSLALRIRQGNAAAIAEALRILADPKAPQAERVNFARTFGEVTSAAALPVLLKVFDEGNDTELLKTTLISLGAYEDRQIAQQVITRYNELPVSVRSAAESLLASRATSAQMLLEAIEAGTIAAGDVSTEAVELVRLYREPEVMALAKKHWGDQLASAEQLQQEIERVAKIVSTGHGSPYQGKRLYTESCAKCHTLFTEGGQVGPDLTAYKRDDLQTMLLHIINPSAEIREGYENHVAITADGRIVSGLLVDQDQRVVILRGHDGQDIVLDREEIDELAPQRRSLMPDGLLNGLTDQQLRDLFAYLRSTQPLNN